MSTRSISFTDAPRTAANVPSERAGISTTFIGTSLVAVATSLPEVVTTFTAVRLVAIGLPSAISSAAIPSYGDPACARCGL